MGGCSGGYALEKVFSGLRVSDAEFIKIIFVL